MCPSELRTSVLRRVLPALLLALGAPAKGAEARTPGGELPRDCGLPLDGAITRADPLTDVDLEHFVAVNQAVVRERGPASLPTAADHLRMLEGLVVRTEEVAASYARACEALGVPPLRYLQTERRVRQVAELLGLEARRIEHQAEQLALEETGRRVPLEVVAEHRAALAKVERSEIEERIAQLEAVLDGDVTTLDAVGEEIETVVSKTAALDRKIAKQAARRGELEALASRHGLEAKHTARALDKLERKMERYRKNWVALLDRREELEMRYRQMIAADLAPKEDVRLALEKARARLVEVDARTHDPAALEADVAKLERHLHRRGRQLDGALEEIEERIAAPEMQQAARDRDAVLDRMPELRGLHRLLPALSDTLAERLAEREGGTPNP